LREAAAWAVEPRSAAMLARRSVAFQLSCFGPGLFGCNKLEEVAALKVIPPKTLRTLRSELRRVYGVFPPSDSPPPAFQKPEHLAAPDYEDERLNEADCEAMEGASGW